MLAKACLEVRALCRKEREEGQESDGLYRIEEMVEGELVKDKQYRHDESACCADI